MNPQKRNASGATNATTDKLVTAVLTASRVLVAVSARSLAEVEERLTLTQFRTLVVLAAPDPTNLNLLAERLGVSPSTALRSVDRLVGLGLTSRQENPDNRREVLIALTDEGQRVVGAVTERRRTEITGILHKMRPQVRTDLIEAFQAFATAAGEPAVLDLVPTTHGW